MFCWEENQEGFLFHYTEPTAAEVITRTETFIVSANALFGTGIYATDRAPNQYEGKELRRHVFMNLWPEPFVRGVVVIARDHDLQFELLAPHMFLYRAQPKARIDLSGYIIGHGECLEDDWQFDASVIVPDPNIRM